MISGNISVNDFLLAQRLHRQRVAKWSYILGALAIIGGVLLVGAGLTRAGVIVLCGGIGGVLGEAFVSFVHLPGRTRKLHAQHKDLANLFTYSWDADSLEGKSVSGASRRPWSHYLKMAEDEHVVLLYHSDAMFELFPKAWFTDPSLLAEFRELAARSVAVKPAKDPS